MKKHYRHVSPDNKKAIAEDVAWETVEGLLTERRKEQYRDWLKLWPEQTIGYIHAWILKLGGYLD